MARPFEKIIPPPRPCNTRHAINMGAENDMADKKEAIVKGDAVRF